VVLNVKNHHQGTKTKKKNVFDVPVIDIRGHLSVNEKFSFFAVILMVLQPMEFTSLDIYR